MARGHHTVGREGFVLSEVDRDIDDIDKIMEEVFTGDTVRRHFDGLIPSQHATEVARLQGGVTIADFGCGTGNTLSTWRTGIIQDVGCDPASVTGIGITLQDYAPHRDDTARAAWESPHLQYVIADITKGLGGIASNSVDSAVAYASVFHWKDPVPGLREVERIIKPGGRLMMNACFPTLQLKRPSYLRTRGVADEMRRWKFQAGHSVIAANMDLSRGKGFNLQTFYCVDFAEAE